MNDDPTYPDHDQDPGRPSQPGEVPPEIPVSNPPNRNVPPSADQDDPVNPAEEDAPVDDEVDGFSE